MYEFTSVWIFVIYCAYKMFQKFTCGICTCDADMTGRTVLVTGANCGIGFETAKDLAERGAKVIFACRSKEKGMAAKDRIYDMTGNENLIYKHLDLASFRSIRTFARDILNTEPKLHVLINNAGTGKLDNSLTEDGLPIEVQVNHFGPFLLTMLLLPLLQESKPSRIINVSSVMHKFGNIDPNTFHKQAKNAYEHMKVYSNTKLANVLFTRQLSLKLMGTGVTVNCLHPGAVSTEIFRHRHVITQFILQLLFRNCWEGAQTSIHLAISPELTDVSGGYFADCRETLPSGKADNLYLGHRLWELSEQIVYCKHETE